ncbi:MAG: hypothetical protein ABI783_05125 [Actinomycetota bacterium]
MVRLRKFLGAVGILVVAAFGTWGYLSKDPFAFVIAAVGLGLWLQSLAIGDHRKLRKFLGAVGLLLVVVLGPLTLMNFAIGSTATPTLLAGTGFGFVFWSATIAREAGLSYRVVVEWMIALLALALGVGVVGLVAILSIGVVGTGIGPFVAAVVYAALVSAASAWAMRHPRAAATLRALRRATMARASEDDSRLLGGGPRALLRSEPTPADG